MTSGRQEWFSPSLSTPCGHPRNYSATPGTVMTSPMLLECTGTGRRHDRHCNTTPGTVTTSPMLLECTGTGRRHDHRCAAYGPPLMAPSNRPTGGSRTTNRYATTLEAAPVRAQDAPRRLDWNRIRHDGRQLHGTARHASTRRKIVRHTCKLLLP
jgi:hypothetical protein